MSVSVHIDGQPAERFEATLSLVAIGGIDLSRVARGGSS
jgi:hypothetical protein